MSPRKPLRVVLYSHDSYGLGHLRRSLSVAAALLRSQPCASALVLTGSPAPDMFDLPPRCDLVKIPSITKNAAGSYVSRHLPLAMRELTSVRSAVITATVRSFRPDLFLVDHTAAGPARELLPAIRRMRHEGLRPRIVLGARDVLDDPVRSRAELRRNGTIEILRELYDEVLVYGDRRVLDVAEAYGFPEDLRAKTHYVGFVCPPDQGVRRPVSGDPTRVVVTAGGGEDGYDVLRSVIAALRGPLRGKRYAVTLVAGPLMPREQVEQLERARQQDGRLHILECTRAMGRLVAGAALVIGMGGYNTVYEALRSRRRLLVTPRVHPRREQLERARRLGRLGLLQSISKPESADVGCMAQAIEAALRRPQPPSGALPFDGAEQAARRLVLGVTRGAEARLLRAKERA